MVFAKHLQTELTMAREGHKAPEDVFYELSRSQGTWHYASMDRATALGFTKAQALCIVLCNTIKLDPDNELVKTFIDKAIPSDIEMDDKIHDLKIEQPAN